MKEVLSLDDIVPTRQDYMQVWRTTYCRYDADYEGVKIQYPRGLSIIYFRQTDGLLAADPHYDPCQELPATQSFFVLLQDVKIYLEDLKSGVVKFPDRIIISTDGAAGLVNLFRKRLDTTHEPEGSVSHLIYTFDRDPQRRSEQLNNLHRMVEGTLLK